MTMILNWLFVLLIFGFQPEGKYERRNQSCGGMSGIDIKWILDLERRNTYSLLITKKTNDFLRKPKDIFTGGTWKMSEDTLKLFPMGSADKAVTFYQKNDTLTLQKSTLPKNEVDLVYLDYLEKAKE